MLLLADPATAVLDPFRQHKTLNLNCFVHDPVTLESYTRDPRYVALKAERYLQTTGIADTVYFGPEAEFFIFDDVRFSQDQRSAFYQVDSIEGIWNSAATRSPTWAFKRATRRATSPSLRWTFPGPALGDDPRDGTAGHRDRGAAPRGGLGRPAEIDMRYDTLLRWPTS